MRIQTRREALSTTAEKIADADGLRRDLIIANEDAAILVRIGDSSVAKFDGTAADVGFVVKAGTAGPFSISSLLGPGAAGLEWWMIADSGTPAVSVLEVFDD